MSERSASRRIRLASILVVVGLLVEALTLTSAQALTFVSFILVSGSLMAAGAGLFLWTLWRDR